MTEQLLQLDDPSAADLGVWELLDIAHTCVFPPGSDPDPAMVAAIRRFHPAFVPVCSWREYRLPTGSRFRQAYFLLARHVTDVYDPDEDLGEPLRIEAWPAGTKGLDGAIYGERLWARDWPPGSKGYDLMLPPIPLDFDWDLVNFMEALHRHLVRTPGSIKKKVMDELMADAAREQRDLEKVEAEALQKLKDDRRQVRRCIAEGRWGPTPGEGPNRKSVSISIRRKAGKEVS